MIKRNNKKGFTIVELVIVIAVIAILAAVLIPTFSGIVKKANLSADQQAVRQMNTALAVDGAVTPTDIFGLHEVLSELGLTSKDYHPLTKDTYFFWDADKNCVLHVDKDMKVIVPADRAGEVYDVSTCNWLSLTLEIKEEEVEIKSDAVKVTSGAQMQYVLNQLNEGTIKNLTINLEGTIDMMGAAFNIPANTNISISGPSASAKATIKNATSVANAKEAISDQKGSDGKYNCALIPSVGSGCSATIENVIIKNTNVKNTDVGNVGLLFGDVMGSATIKDVTIVDSTVIGHRNVGALAGRVYKGTLTIEGTLDLDNVDVKTVGGRSGMLVGLIETDGGTAATKVVTTNAKISLDKDCSYGIYECEQNTGTFDGDKLGFNSETGMITSYTSRYNATKKDYDKEKEVKPYVENALAMTEPENNKFVADTTTFANVSWAK